MSTDERPSTDKAYFYALLHKDGSVQITASVEIACMMYGAGVGVGMLAFPAVIVSTRQLDDGPVPPEEIVNRLRMREQQRRKVDVRQEPPPAPPPPANLPPPRAHGKTGRKPGGR